MQIPSTSRIRMYVPVFGPLGVDWTAYPCSVALIPDEEGREPEDAEYHPGEWVNREATLKPPGGAAWGGDFDDGEYMCWVRVLAAAADEDVRMKAGRVRIGELGDVG
jgi:hypothetical protein